QVLGADRLVELADERPIVWAARLVAAAIARAPRLGGVVGVAHLRVVGHLGGRRVHRLGGVLGQLVGRGLGLLQAHALQLVRVGGLAVLAVLVLAAAPAIGASRRSGIAANLPRWNWSSSRAARLLAPPDRRRAPTASTRACSTASNPARACWPPGTSRRCTDASWQAMRSAIE